MNTEDEYLFTDFDEIYNHFGAKTLQDRYSFIYEKMENYIQERYNDNSILINEDLLQQVIIDYFADIYRLKKFHRIEHVNPTKIAAYEVYWIWRRKPLQLSIQKNNSSKKLFANEGFLTMFIAHECLECNPTDPMTDEQEQAYLAFLRHINYYFKYRSVDKQALEIMLVAWNTGRIISK